MENLLQGLHELSNPWAVMAVFFALHSANAFIPMIPAESALLAAGYLWHTKLPLEFSAVLASTAGAVAGNYLLFFLIRKFGAKRFLNITEDCGRYHRLRGLLRSVQRNGFWALFTARFLPGMTIITVIAAALARLPDNRFLAGVALSNFIFFTGLSLTGGLLRNTSHKALLALNANALPIWPLYLLLGLVIIFLPIIVSRLFCSLKPRSRPLAPKSKPSSFQAE